jgi:hypothetical protein
MAHLQGRQADASGLDCISDVSAVLRDHYEARGGVFDPQHRIGQGGRGRGDSGQ